MKLILDRFADDKIDNALYELGEAIDILAAKHDWTGNTVLFALMHASLNGEVPDYETLNCVDGRPRLDDILTGAVVEAYRLAVEVEDQDAADACLRKE